MTTKSFGTRRRSNLAITLMLMLLVWVESQNLFLVITNQNQKSEMAFASNGSSSNAQTNNSNNNINTINNSQLWIDKLSNIKIQFSHLPPYPFVGNRTELNFKITDLKTDKPLEVTHVHVLIIKNVTANLGKTNGITKNDDFVTFDNMTAPYGIFSLKYQFELEGTHQIIVKLNTKDGEVSLASFRVPVIIPE